MNLISINDLTTPQIRSILRNDFEVTQVGGSAILLFAEPSTRTRISFELAAHHNGISPLYLDPQASSLVKGESLLDTFKTLSVYEPEYLIIRHKNGTACQMAESVFGPETTIISAGTGTTNHPTQALGDALVIDNVFRNQLAGRVLAPRVAIVGDIVHSRVARSLIQICQKLGWEVRLFGPPEFTPSHGMGETDGLVYHSLTQLGWANFVYVLRPQLERLEEDMFNKDNYISNWRIDASRLGPYQYVMHAGPMNTGVEITTDAIEYSNSLIYKQVQACYEIRKTLLRWLKVVNNGVPIDG